MTRRKPNKPTDGELELLTVLWRQGPSTVREIQEAVASPKTVGRTTVLKLLQIMFEKGLVHRDESGRSHVYRPAIDKAKMETRFLDDILARLFDGSTGRLVMRALATKPASPEELAAIRRLLDERKESRDE